MKLTHFFVKEPGNLRLKLVTVCSDGERTVWDLGRAYVDEGLYYAWVEGWYGTPGVVKMKWVYKTGTLTKKAKGKFIVFECARP